MLVEIEVARASLALTAALINAFQSIPVVELLPDVVDEFDNVVLLEPVVALLTVMTAGPLQASPGRPVPARMIHHQPSSLSRYCGIWFAAASADTAACVFTSAEDNFACSAAMSTSLMAELAD